MFHIANDAGRSGSATAHALLIYIKNELIVRADMNDEMVRLLGDLDDFAEVQHRPVTLGDIRRGDPLCCPRFQPRTLGGSQQREKQRECEA